MENIVCFNILNSLYILMSSSTIEKSKEEVFEVLKHLDQSTLFEANKTEEKMDAAAYDERMKEKEAQLKLRE